MRFRPEHQPRHLDTVVGKLENIHIRDEKRKDRTGGRRARPADKKANAFIADCIGDAKLIDVEVTQSGETTQIALMDRKLTLPEARLLRVLAKMVLYRDHVHLGSDTAPEALPAEVAYAVRPGKPIRYTPAMPVGSIFAIAAPQALPFRQGESVYLGFGLQHVRLVPSLGFNSPARKSSGSTKSLVRIVCQAKNASIEIACPKLRKHTADHVACAASRCCQPGVCQSPPRSDQSGTRKLPNSMGIVTNRRNA